MKIMGRWPDSWKSVEKDVPAGQALVEEFVPFVEHLAESGLKKRTVRNHVDNLWAIGGEIVREFCMEPDLRLRPPRELLLRAVEHGEAPLLYSGSEAEQRSCDTTARKLLEWLLRKSE